MNATKATSCRLAFPRFAVKQKLVEMRYTMKDLAEATKIPYNTLNTYLNGYVETVPAQRVSQIMDQLTKWGYGK